MLGICNVLPLDKSTVPDSTKGLTETETEFLKIMQDVLVSLHMLANIKCLHCHAFYLSRVLTLTEDVGT